MRTWVGEVAVGVRLCEVREGVLEAPEGLELQRLRCPCLGFSVEDYWHLRRGASLD
eukprot:COSAG02_NODE_61352_length_269_cov_0.494118_1_plen_55_part_01